jgi:hypothetical protein
VQKKIKNVFRSVYYTMQSDKISDNDTVVNGRLAYATSSLINKATTEIQKKSYHFLDKFSRKACSLLKIMKTMYICVVDKKRQHLNRMRNNKRKWNSEFKKSHCMTIFDDWWAGFKMKFTYSYTYTSLAVQKMLC